MFLRCSTHITPPEYVWQMKHSPLARRIELNTGRYSDLPFLYLDGKLHLPSRRVNLYFKEHFLITSNGQVSPTAELTSPILKYLKNTSQTRKINTHTTAQAVRFSQWLYKFHMFERIITTCKIDKR